MNQRRKWIGVAAGLFLLYLLVSGNRGLWRLYKLHQQKQVLTEDIARLKVEIANYQAEYQAYGRNPASLERRAREELNLVKPGEIVYKFGTASP